MSQRLLVLAALLVPALAFGQAAPVKPAKAPTPSAVKTAKAKPAAKAGAETKTETKPAATAAQSAPKVRIDTSLGSMVVELYPAKAPKTVENFLGYVNSGFYKGTIFHRVIGNFMIQGGGFTADLQQKQTRAPIAIESNNGLSNLAGTVAMARTADPNSASSQFFINVVDNPRLDYASDANPGYTVFGKVVQGMDVVAKIKAVPTGPKGQFRSDVPTTTVTIDQVSVEP